jgi:hypothetical protein
MSDTSQRMPNGEPFDLERAPLDEPADYGTDWGGDGSDPTRPVRAHVLAALRPSGGPYAPPLDGLLRTEDELEDPEALRERLGIAQEHVPELIRMARDRSLITAPSDSPLAWAPGYALQILGELELGERVAELVPLFDYDNDYIAEELPWVIGTAGAPAIPPLRAYLEDRTRWVWGHTNAADALKEVAERHPELRDEVVALLSELLDRGDERHELAPTGLLSALVDLKAVEALPVMRRAHELGRIDESVNGAWGEVLQELGLTPDITDPLLAVSQRRFDERHAAMFGGAPRGLAAPQVALPRLSSDGRSTNQQKKQKNKRKAAAASRKANKKKKRR